MTDRLSQLMHDEIDHLDIPAPPASAVLGRGRGLRRRRRAAQGVSALAVLAVMGAAVAVNGGSNDLQASDPGPADTPAGAVFSIGTTVYLDGGATRATIDDRAIKSMFFTSAGVLVRHGNNPYSDGGGPQRFSLVTDDGTVKPVSVVTNEVVPGVDATQPYLAYAVVEKGVVQVVVQDLRTDREVARVPVPDAEKWGGWSAPPVSLSGDLVYVGTDDVARVVDWRTGEVSETDDVEPGYPPAVKGGRVAVYPTDVKGGQLSGDGTQTTSVVDVASGETLLSVSSGGYGYFDLSPDGRHALLDVEETDAGGPPESGFRVYDVDSGEFVTVDGQAYEFTWTQDGDLFGVTDQGRVVTCDSGTGECASASPDLDVLPNSSSGEEDFSDDLVLGGQIRES